jgi:hypothetical protein
MPVLDLQSSACSCTGNPQNTSIQNSTNLTYVESNSEDDGDQHDEEANDASDELYTTTFAIKGSTYNNIYQVNLKTVQSALRLKKPMTIQLEKEPDNPKDSNVILVKVCVDDLFLIIGYIGVKKLPKVVSAIRLREIVVIKVISVTTWLVRNLNFRKLRCKVRVLHLYRTVNKHQSHREIHKNKYYDAPCNILKCSLFRNYCNAKTVQINHTLKQT